MRPEDLQVNLRPRSSWEAMELGTALLRRHAGAVWRPWLLALLPLFAALNALAWALGQPWLAWLALWWLKPALERIVLYVLSRAVFGQAPGALAALRAQWRFARPMLGGYLSWRRLGPARSLLMPVDLLEGSQGAQRGMRRRVVAGPVYMQAALLTVVCAHFELALLLGCIAAVFLFVPAEQLPGSLQSFWGLLQDGPPRWLDLCFNVAAAAALAVVGPFYVAAGFGMYLNRRSESEAWDVELAFRRLRERLLARAAPLLVVFAIGLAALVAPPVQAQDGQAEAEDVPTLPVVFGRELQDDTGFRRAAARAYEDPLIGGKRTLVEWKPKHPATPKERSVERPAWLDALAGLVALGAEWGLWILLGVLLLVLALTARHWLPWLRGSGRAARRKAPAAAQVDELVLPETLPDDIPSAARRLWSEGRQRAALALLYRASVEAMVARTGAPLAPGATEAQCLRASRQLPGEEARGLFARMVKVWQYAAYAGRLPDDAGFETLLQQSQAQWTWTP